MDDYEEVYALWMSIHGFGIRTMDDAKEGVERFIRRNPTTSMVAVLDGQIIGAILCGHDGRRGCLYHVCVREAYRKHGIGQKLVLACLDALRKEQINKVNLIAFQSNEVGNRFWQGLGWDFRSDVNYYECILNPDNVTNFNP
jgi:ribosomal protein S18 acetylase RimI-like enzyme